jgi:hypothetical protein
MERKELNADEVATLFRESLIGRRGMHMPF